MQIKKMRKILKCSARFVRMTDFLADDVSSLIVIEKFSLQNLNSSFCIDEKFAEYKDFLYSDALNYQSLFISQTYLLMEAVFFSDYIISIDVGIAKNIQKKFKGLVAEGYPNKQENDEKITNQILLELQKCIDNPACGIINEATKNKIRDYFSMSNLVKKSFYKNFFNISGGKK